MAEKKVYKLSSRGRRFLAGVIDAAIPTVIAIVMLVAYVVILASSVSYYDYSYDGYGSAMGAAAGAVVVVIIAVLLDLAFIVAEIIFYSKSQSIGKAILGMQVVRNDNGKPLGFWWMLLREFIVKPACGSAYFLGYIWILIDKKNRGWHDKILDTYVVDAKPIGKHASEPVAPASEVTPVQDMTVVEEPVAVEVSEVTEIKSDFEAVATEEPIIDINDIEQEQSVEVDATEE